MAVQFSVLFVGWAGPSTTVVYVELVGLPKLGRASLVSNTACAVAVFLGGPIAGIIGSECFDV